MSQLVNPLNQQMSRLVSLQTRRILKILLIQMSWIVNGIPFILMKLPEFQCASGRLFDGDVVDATTSGATNYFTARTLFLR